MECKRCGEEREYLNNGLCIFCIRAETLTGKEIKENRILNLHGKEIISKSGSIKKGEEDNAWMSNI